MLQSTIYRVGILLYSNVVVSQRTLLNVAAFQYIPPILLVKFFYVFLRPQCMETLYAVTVLFTFSVFIACERHVLNTRAQPVYYAHYRHRLETGLLLLRFFFRLSLTRVTRSNDISR